MKDLRSSLGAGTFPAKEDTAGTIKALVVRNLGQYGRRVAIYTDEGELVVGGRVHAADFQHTPKYAAAPEGFQTGLSVELAAKREYVEIFSFIAPAAFDIIARKKGASQQVRMSSALTHGLEDSTEYNPAVAVNEFQTGNLSLEPGFIGRNFASFTIEVDGTLHDIAFDVMKHPARMTADVNYQLFAIHPQLRCVVAMAEDYETAEAGPGWSVFFSEPKGVQVRFPQTNYTTVNYEVETDGTLGFGQFQIAHLNNYLDQPIEILGGEPAEYEAVVIEDPRLVSAPDIITLVTSVVRSTQDLQPTGDTWKPEITLAPSDFHTLAEDPRYKVALVGLSPDFNNGDIYYLNKVEVVTGEISKLAELLPVMGTRADGKQYSTRLIDLDASVEAGKLVGTSLVDIGTDSKQALITRTSLNELQFGKNLAIAVLVPAEGFNRFAPLFRTPESAVTVALTYSRSHFSEPTVEITQRSYLWEKAVDAKATINFQMDTVPGAVIKRVGAIHDSGTLVEENPEVSVYGGRTHVQFKDGFSRRELTFGKTEGEIAVEVELVRTADNKSAATNLFYSSITPYTVTLPTPEPVISIGTVREFVEDVENPQDVVFKGKITQVGGARFPAYYFEGVKFTFSVGGDNVYTAMGSIAADGLGLDADYDFRFTITKGALSNYGQGVHQLDVKADITYLWGDEQSLTTAAQFEILPEVEGVEDDIAFITPTWLNHDTATTMEGKGNIRIVDLDSGNVLAEGNSIETLMASAVAGGEVAVDMIYGNEFEIDSEISCEGSLPSTTMKLAGSFDLEINGLDKGIAENVYELARIGGENGLEISAPEFAGNSAVGLSVHNDTDMSKIVHVMIHRYGRGGVILQTHEYDGTLDQLRNRNIAPELEWFDVDGMLVPQNSVINDLFVELRFTDMEVPFPVEEDEHVTSFMIGSTQIVQACVSGAQT